MQPFVVPPACSPRPPLIRLNKAVLPPHRHFSDAPITLLRNYINAKIPVADAHFIPFCIFPSISQNQFLDPDLLCSYNSTGMDAFFTASAETCESCEGWVLVHKESSPSPSPPILPMKLFTLSAYNFIANHTVRRYSTKQTGQPPVYYTILTREDLYLFIHPRIRDTLFFPNQTDLLQNSISSSLFVVPSKRNGGDTSTRKSKKRNDDIPANPPISPQIQHFVRLTNAVALDAAVAVLSEPEQILVNTEELVKTGNSRHAIGLTRHRPRLATAARLHLHPLAARLLRFAPPLQRVSGRAGLDSSELPFNIVNSTLSLDALIFDVESLGCTNAKLAIPSPTLSSPSRCAIVETSCVSFRTLFSDWASWHRRLWSTTRTTFAINCTKHHVFLMDLRGNLNPNPRLVIDSSNISCDKATTLPDSEHQIITHHSVSTDDSNSEFTSLDGASRTRTLQEADSIAFIQVSNCQFSDQTFSGSGVVLVSGTFHVLRAFDSLFENN
ncbi:hypothetical protein BLNAU_23505 [Blattamonas nauphoetae]|uniref:Uncharacterized protein n=1 Tax=Blattamonas nauphoetae TaxID=2049346 RepID=A0ABQ9WT02_9EUKA|nr:hypothetical protein BLNAU_23505 [Blattamonas nauphoetae]